MKPAMLREEPGRGQARRRPAVSLAYDGADPSHLEIVAPLLAELGIPATFYLPSVQLLQQPREWAALQNEGHEMGSHSLYGCTDERGNLPNWTLDMVEEDLRMSRKLLTEQFPRQSDFSFAYPGDLSDCVRAPFDPRPADYREAVERLFRVARTSAEGLNDLGQAAPMRLKSIQAACLGAETLLEIARRAEAEGSWAILVFGPIGSGDNGTDLRAHRTLLDFLAGHPSLECGTVYRTALMAALPSTAAAEIGE